jgi:hypothetical protein
MAQTSFNATIYNLWNDAHDGTVNAINPDLGRFQRASGVGWVSELLCDFDVSAIANATINSAYVTFTVVGAQGGTNAQTVYLYEQDKTNPTGWSTPPVFDDFAHAVWTTELNNVANVLNNGTYTIPESGTNIKDLVQSWVDNAADNWGMILSRTDSFTSLYVTCGVATLFVDYEPYSLSSSSSSDSSSSESSSSDSVSSTSSDSSESSNSSSSDSVSSTSSDSSESSSSDSVSSTSSDSSESSESSISAYGALDDICIRLQESSSSLSSLSSESSDSSSESSLSLSSSSSDSSSSNSVSSISSDSSESSISSSSNSSSSDSSSSDSSSSDSSSSDSSSSDSVSSTSSLSSESSLSSDSSDSSTSSESSESLYQIFFGKGLPTMRKNVIFDFDFPQNILPVIEVNTITTAQGNIKLLMEDLEEINSLTASIYTVTPPDATYDNWPGSGADLYTSIVLDLQSKKLSDGTNSIFYSFDPSAIAGIESGQFYGVRIKINADDDAAVIQAGPEMIMKITDQISEP